LPGNKCSYGFASYLSWTRWEYPKIKVFNNKIIFLAQKPMSSLSSPSRSPASPPILETRRDYRACHIRLPMETQRIPAILWHGSYYSLVKVVPDRQRALMLCERLIARGNTPVITATPKGNAIWTLEPDAAPAAPGDRPQPAIAATCKLLGDHNSYQPCHIRVPDLDNYLAAIRVDNQYYGLLKVVGDRQHALELANRLQRKGDEVVVTHSAQSYALWIREPDAKPVD